MDVGRVSIGAFADKTTIHCNTGSEQTSAEVVLTLEEILAAAYYALTNTDLEEGDPRLRFLDDVRRIATGPGWNRGRTRLVGGPRDPDRPVSDALSDTRVVDVRVTLLVTDVNASIVDANLERWKSEDRHEIAERVRDAIRYDDASAVDVRQLTISVPLLKKPGDVAATAGATTPEVTVAPEIASAIAHGRKVAEQDRDRRRVEDLDRLRSRLLEVLPPGHYEVYSNDGGRGIRRE
ncbi:hypothetical protein HY480_02335 [Candidatus Uhrbacteria bacterium]|nr:hypothetical protein [Candidatus Uhrbacteria bacterium]